MKITIEYQGYPTDKVPKTVVYENDPKTEGDTWVDKDWDFLFHQLKEYRDHLKLRARHEENLGRQLSIQAKVDKLERLFQKYLVFIQMLEEERYDL